MTRRALLFAAGALIALACAACGIQTGSAGLPDAAGTPAVPPEHVREQRARELPQRPKGTVAVTGQRHGSPTQEAGVRVAGPLGVRLRFTAADDRAAFRRLCRGQADLVETTRAPSAAELRLCDHSGVDLLADPATGGVAALHVASDAVVLATRNERDAGGDCLTVGAARQLFRAGSRIRNWSQLGFADHRLVTTGPGASASEFAAFAERILGVAHGATLDDVRAGYRSRPTAAAVRREVMRHGGRRGRAVGLFRFTYYELFENQLRPLEVWAAGGKAAARPADGLAGQRPLCVFPSQGTVAGGSYPLSFRITLFAPRRSVARPEVRAFVRGYLRRAQEVATGRRLVPVDERTLRRQIAIVDAAAPSR